MFSNFFFLKDASYSEYNIKNDFYIEENLVKPNIYWIHADAMINLKDASRYFGVDNTDIINYFEKNSFYYNPEASFWGGNHTITALTALFNPSFYDNEYSSYLLSLQKAMKGNDDSELRFPSASNIEDIRFNNELFSSLKKADYETIVITEYNQYSSFDADYIFDYNAMNHNDKSELLYYDSKNSVNDLKTFASVVRFKTLADLTVFGSFIRDFNFLSYEKVDYNDFDYSNYSIIGNSDYWKAKAMIKSLDLVSEKKDNSKSSFTFIDFSIAHPPWIYDNVGNEVSDAAGLELNDFTAVYSHASDLLIELLQYIRNNDSNAVIVVQADHGLHLIPLESLQYYLKIDYDEAFKLYESTINAVYVPEIYLNGEEEKLSEPLNLSRYIINSYVGNNYSYIE